MSVLGQDLIPGSFQVGKRYLESTPSLVLPEETRFNFWNADTRVWPFNVQTYRLTWVLSSKGGCFASAAVDCELQAYF